MVGTIICALDFNSSPEKILEWAADTSKQHHAPLIILCAYRLTPSGGADDAQILRARAEAKANSQFQEIEKKLLEYRISSYSFLVEVGFLSDRIQSHVNRNENSMLIIANDTAKSISGPNDTDFINYLDQLNIPTILLPSYPTVVENPIKMKTN